MKKQILNEEFRRMQQLAGVITESYLDEAMYYVHDKEGMEEPEGPYTLDQAKQKLTKLGAEYNIIDADTAKQIWSYLEQSDEISITPEIKAFIDKVISDAKRDDEFEYLKDVDFFDNDLIDLIMDEFDDDGNYNDVSQEIKDYIANSIK
jgi:hypothetical protein